MIPVNEPLLSGNEKKYLAECVDSGWISSEGPFVTKLEQLAAEYTGRRYGVAVSSGTGALDIAVAALGIGAGDEVILPTFTIISCLSAVVRTGATPVFVDADPDTWCLDVSQIQTCISPRTRAVMAVHIYGLTVDMGPLLRLCEQHGLALIEDSAEGLGCLYDGRPCGSFGRCSVLSFYPNKLVTTGEGGMVLTDDESLAERCRSLRNLCFQAKQRFVHEEYGWNYRMSNLQAAVGVAQFERVHVNLERKKEIGLAYQDALNGREELQLPLAQTPHTENAYWVYGVVLGDTVPFQAKEAMSRLAERGVGTRPFFWPMHLQPVLSDQAHLRKGEFPVAERLGQRGFYLPSGLALRDSQVAQVCEALAEVLA